MEIWKDVVGYEGKYLISSLGRVKGKRGVMKTQIQKNGYEVVRLWNPKKTKRVHRLVAEAFISNPQGKKEVNHRDGNKANNKLTNLEWVTRRENRLHMFELGLDSNRGDKNPRFVGEEHNWVNKYTGEREYCSPYELKNKYNLHNDIYSVAKRKKGYKSYKGWMLDGSGEGIR